jgi:hypothetical protein
LAAVSSRQCHSRVDAPVLLLEPDELLLDDFLGSAFE